MKTVIVFSIIFIIILSSLVNSNVWSENSSESSCDIRIGVFAVEYYSESGERDLPYSIEIGEAIKEELDGEIVNDKRICVDLYKNDEVRIEDWIYVSSNKIQYYDYIIFIGHGSEGVIGFGKKLDKDITYEELIDQQRYGYISFPTGKHVLELYFIYTGERVKWLILMSCSSLAVTEYEFENIVRYVFGYHKEDLDSLRNVKLHGIMGVRGLFIQSKPTEILDDKRTGIRAAEIFVKKMKNGASVFYAWVSAIVSTHKTSWIDNAFIRSMGETYKELKKKYGVGKPCGIYVSITVKKGSIVIAKYNPILNDKLGRELMSPAEFYIQYKENYPDATFNVEFKYYGKPHAGAILVPVKRSRGGGIGWQLFVMRKFTIM